MPVFRFDKAFGIARRVKVSLLRKKIQGKKRELSQIRSELQTSKDRAERIEHQKRKKRVKQEVFHLNRKLRAVEGIPDSGPAPQKAGGPETGALPNFIIIGAKKGGTSSLYHLLTRHPYVEPAAAKELNYFDSLFEEGIKWYRHCFPAPRWKDGRKLISGEATPGYLFHPFVPERMAQAVPQARLIALLRNPVDRAYSDYNQRAGQGENRTFEEAVEAEMYQQPAKTPEDGEPTSLDDALYHGYLSKGIYVDQLLRWSKFFSDEQMLVLKSEDFFERPWDALDLVLDFLDLPHWEPEAWEIRNKGTYEQNIDPVIRQRLEDYFEPHNQRLYEYLGVDFGWLSRRERDGLQDLA